MKWMKVFIMLIISFLWITPNAFAVFRDDGTSSEKSGIIQGVEYKRTYHDIVEERKRKSREAIPKRKKRKSTLTPFVHNTSQEFSDLSQFGKNTGEKNSLQEDLSKKTSLSPLVGKMDMSNKIQKGIFLNFLVIAACFGGFILLSKYLRTKK